MVCVVPFKWFNVPFIAPIIDRCFAVTDNLWNLRCGHHIGILRKHFSVILPQIFESTFRNFCSQFYGIITFIPVCRGGITFGKDFSIFKIFDNIFLFDFITSCFLAVVFARYLAASKQIQRRGFADMANFIKLVFCYNFGNRIPVDCSFIHSNTPLKIFCRCRRTCVLPFLIILPLFFPEFLRKRLSSCKKTQKSTFIRTLLCFRAICREIPKSL